jgi:hypothetical protein
MIPSLRALVAGPTVLSVLSLAAPARAAPPPSSRDVVAVVVGANIGGADEAPLHFAMSDARRVADVLVELGQVSPGNTIVVTADTPEQVLGALRQARDRAQALAASGRPKTFVFYYSGHGDDDSIHLAKGLVPMSDLRTAIAAIPVDLRVSVIDACRTGGRAKGVGSGAAFDLAAAPDSPHGSVELRASSVGEAAQESDELGGAVFTHFLVSGLRGAADADHDGRVTLAELYAYTYRATLLRTTSAPILQHPSVLMNLAGAGEVVLTTPSGAPAFLEVPRGPERYLVFARPSDSAMGEVSGEGAARLALPAGRFLVVRRVGSVTSVASVDLAWGGTKRLTSDEFRGIAREELARRGGTIELRPLRIDGRVGVELAPAAGDRLGLRAGAALAYASGSFEAEIEAAYVGGPFSSTAFDGGVHAIAGGPSVGLRSVVGRVTWLGFVGAEIRQSWEQLERASAARASAAGLPATENRSFFSAGPRAGGRAALALGGDLSASITVYFTGLLRREIDETGAAGTVLHPVLGGGLAIGYAF